jgi:hypothetical protein
MGMGLHLMLKVETRTECSKVHTCTIIVPGLLYH